MKHWLSVKEAAEVMGCSRPTAYTRIKKLERDHGRPIIVKRTLQGRTRNVVSAIDIARIHGPDTNLAELLEIKETLDGLMAWTTLVNEQLKAISDRVGVVKVS